MAKGQKTGGRQKGTPNRVTAAIQEEVAASGETPKDYMLRVMRDEEAEPARRDAMAKAAAPFCHPHLQSVEHKGNKDNPIALLLQSIDGTTRGLPGKGK